MVHATIREEIASGRALASRRVPERVKPLWALIFIAIDAMAVLSACYIAGFSATAGPAACVVTCGALALCGTYTISYAVRWYDEAYQIAVASALALVPLWVLFHFIGDLPTAAPLVVILISGILMASMHSALRLARDGAREVPEATAAYVTPEAQWKARHGAFPIWKRLFDVTLAAAGLVLTSPLLLLAAVCIAVESGFPILFRQDRVGRNGIVFTMYKFRTMWRDAGSNWATHGDRRITNVGALLRASSIDELPQLLNVIFGDMSLVGPRPEMPEFARNFRHRIVNYDARSIVRPGLTGWAQVYYKRNLQPDEMADVVPYDLFYVEHASPAVDAIVVIKTAVEFLAHRGV